MPWTDAFETVEREYGAAVERDTWGHLAPEQNRSYRGSLLFTHTEWGQWVLIRGNFDGLDWSPWLFDAAMEFVEKHATEEGGLYQWRGTFRNYRWYGKPQKLVL